MAVRATASSADGEVLQDKGADVLVESIDSGERAAPCRKSPFLQKLTSGGALDRFSDLDLAARKSPTPRIGQLARRTSSTFSSRKTTAIVAGIGKQAATLGWKGFANFISGLGHEAGEGMRRRTHSFASTILDSTRLFNYL